MKKSPIRGKIGFFYFICSDQLFSKLWLHILNLICLTTLNILQNLSSFFFEFFPPIWWLFHFEGKTTPKKIQCWFSPFLLGRFSLNLQNSSNTTLTLTNPHFSTIFLIPLSFVRSSSLNYKFSFNMCSLSFYLLAIKSNWLKIELQQFT